MTDVRSLPSYGPGEIDVPFVIARSDEVVARDTLWSQHSHPTHELLWNDRGASTATIGSRVWTITSSIGLWIPAGTPHSGWMPAGTSTRAAQFSVTATTAIADQPVTVEISDLLRLLLDRLGDDALTPQSRATTEAMILDLLVPSTRELLLQVPRSALVAPIVDAMRTDPADTTTLAEWASRLQVSTRTITRVFRSETGVGFERWSATGKVQHAIALLARGEDIDEVAHLVGYRSSSAFSTAFRRVTGMSPGRFRAR